MKPHTRKEVAYVRLEGYSDMVGGESPDASVAAQDVGAHRVGGDGVATDRGCWHLDGR